MKKVYLSVLILFIYSVFFITPTGLQAYNGPPSSCAIPGKVTSVSFSDVMSLGQPVTATVTFSTVNTDRNWNFFIKVPHGVGTDLESPSQKIGNSTESTVTLTFTTRTALSTFRDSYEIQLEHSEGPGAAEVCKLGTFTIGDADIDKAQCSVSVPSNVQARTPFNISIGTNPTSNVNYSLRFYPQSFIPTLGSPNTVLRVKQSEYDSLINTTRSIFSRPITQDSTTINYANDGSGGSRVLDTGATYALFVFATKVAGGETFYKYCRADVHVDNNPTTSAFNVNPTTIGSGGTITAAWSAQNSFSSATYLGLYNALPGSDQTNPVSFWYLNSCNTSAGSIAKFDGACPLTMPTQANPYQLRLYQDDDAQTPIQTFNITVTPPVAGPNPGNPGGPGTGTGGCTSNCSSSAGKECNPATGGDGKGGIRTAIGCVPTEPKALIESLMRFSAAIGGGIALLLMIAGAIQMMTSGGNPESIKKGRDQFVAAAVGLLFVIFSALILRIIGVDILNIPGLS